MDNAQLEMIKRALALYGADLDSEDHCIVSIAKLSNEILDDLKDYKRRGADLITLKKRFSDDNDINYEVIFQELLKNGSVTISFSSTKMPGKFEIYVNIEGRRTLTATNIHKDDILFML